MRKPKYRKLDAAALAISFADRNERDARVTYELANVAEGLDGPNAVAVVLNVLVGGAVIDGPVAFIVDLNTRSVKRDRRVSVR